MIVGWDDWRPRLSGGWLVNGGVIIKFASILNRGNQAVLVEVSGYIVVLVPLILSDTGEFTLFYPFVDG